MPADASIYGQIRQPQPIEGPLDQYGKALNLRALMGEGRLRELQTQQLEQNMGEEQATRDVFKNAAPGSTLESLLPDVMRASPKAGITMQGQVLKQKQEAAATEHTQAQTKDLTAGHIAGAWSVLAQSGGDDESIKQTQEMLTPIIGAQAAEARTQKLLSMPPGARLAYAVAQASQHKTGQEAMKLLFPKAEIPPGTDTPVSMTTLPGRPAPGTPIPGAVPILRTASPDALIHDATARRGQDMTDARQRELNGIMEGQNIEATPALIKGIASGEIALNPPPTNARNPVMLQRYGQMLEKVKAENPNWSAEMYPTIKRTVGSFAAGKEGATLKALNTSIDHLDTWEELGRALKNGNVQMLNNVYNKIAAATGSTAPTNFEAARQILGNEIVKGITGAAGGVEDRAKSQEVMGSKSPQQMLETAQTLRKLLGGQLTGLEQQYQAGTYGRKDFKDKYLTPAARKAFDGAQSKGSAAGGAPVKFLGFE